MVVVSKSKSKFNASRSYVKNICLYTKCIIGIQFDGAELREREMQSMSRAGDARNKIKNRCFRTLILKLVNPLEPLEDRIAIHT